jgi:two-component system alkaline phosphatase synthesis response regulator PhoP
MTSDPRRVLVVEDDPAIRRGVVAALAFAGYDVLEAADGPRGLVLAETAEVDLVLLDVVLPGTDGLEILRRVRESRPTRPVILLTARAAEDDRVGGLAAGADDYVVKPFSVRELLARVEAVLRRSPERPRPVAVIACDGLVVDFARREIRHADGDRVELSEKEAELAAYLAAHAGRAISREELLRRVWRLDPRGVTTRTIDMHVMRLREKLRDDTTAPRRVLTVRGQGYAWAAVEAAP